MATQASLGKKLLGAFLGAAAGYLVVSLPGSYVVGEQFLKDDHCVSLIEDKARVQYESEFNPGGPFMREAFECVKPAMYVGLASIALGVVGAAAGWRIARGRKDGPAPV